MFDKVQQQATENKSAWGILRTNTYLNFWSMDIAITIPYSPKHLKTNTHMDFMVFEAPMKILSVKIS